ncbi:MAG: S8 family peptidase [Chitinophagaceae bacterium]
MTKLLAFFTAILLLSTGSSAQLNRYVVRLKNKGATTFTLASPSAYLSQRAIDRRIRYSISVDSSDLPIPSTYITQIRNIPNVTVLNTSRWLNAVTIRTTDANAITAINALPFVITTTGIAARNNNRSGRWEEEITDNIRSSHRGQQVEANYFDYGTGASFNEIHLHNGEFLHNVGLRGQGMQIAILDGGFFHYTTLKAFDSANINGQILTTWDFVNNESSVVEDDSHGMSCLSTIVANIPGTFIGKAPKASFHLFKTEDTNSEYPIEEFNWACGAEKADSSGADIISSSLGYGYEFGPPVADYPYSDLNGDITMSAQAADLAAKKGLMVFNAAGNSGTDYWHMITTPADGDSVVAVGAVNTSGVVGAFSSYGPSADGRIKPDVASIGVSALIETTGNTVATGNGTSFACPNMAGLGTCLWQGFPEFNNMRIVRALKEAGSIYTAPDDRIGYGIPDMKKAFTALLTDFATSSASVSGCTVTVNWTSKDVAAMKYEIERKAPGDVSYTKVGDVPAQAGNLLANHTYQFSNTLSNVAAGTISYRIRQVVDTTAATFTAVYIDTANVALTTTACADLNTVKLYVSPNPTNSSTSLIIETNNAIANMPIVVYNMRGQLVMQLQRSKGANKAIVDLPVQPFAKGKYIVQVYNGTKLLGSVELLKL